MDSDSENHSDSGDIISLLRDPSTINNTEDSSNNSFANFSNNNNNNNNNWIPLNTQQGERENLPGLSPRKPRNMKNLSLDLNTPVQKQQHEEAIKTILADKPPTLFRARTGSNSLPFRQHSISIHNKPSSSSSSSSSKTFDRPAPLQRRRTTLAISIPKSTINDVGLKSSVPKSDQLAMSNSPIIPLSSTQDGFHSTAYGFFDKDLHQQQQQSLTHSINGLNLTDDSRPDSFRTGAYQNGPICVFEPNLYLYSEPTLDQIRQFDIVINVAKELKDYSELIANDNTINTKYIFVPWTHTSQICHDFADLVPVIEKGLAQNEKILIHCQCGVSRSASLIVAFIMKFRATNLNDAYNELKTKAPLISPNMTLIFQLMEWNNTLTGKIPVNSNVSTPTSAVGGSSSSNNNLNLFVPPNLEFVSSPTMSEVMH